MNSRNHKSSSVQNIKSINAQFVRLWCCVLSGFVVQINNFFSLVLFSAVIHKRWGKKLISKTIKYILDSSLKMQFAFFILQTFKNVFEKLSILPKIWKWSNFKMTQILCVIMTQCAGKSISDSYEEFWK